MAGIYIHIPYCKQKCIYCDFHFRTNQSDKLQMIECIKDEIKFRKDYLDNSVIDSIYFGGGTPSILNTKEINSILNTIYETFIINNEVEITLECNPDDLKLENIKKITKTKINRLSIGVQSFHDEDLFFLKRAHSSKQAIDSIISAQNLGIQNITIDLIYGIPNQKHEIWAYNLEQINKLNIPHFSAYSLTVEPNTKLKYLIKTKEVNPVSDTNVAKQFNYLINVAKKNNFINYEISSFGRDGFFSKHNTSYWKNKKYLGVGPSAHSYNKISRSCNVSSNTKYIAGILNNKPFVEEEYLTIDQQYNEYILTSLRTIWGVDILYLKQKFGLEKSNYFISKIIKWKKQNKVDELNGKYILSNIGKLYADAITTDLFII